MKNKNTIRTALKSIRDSVKYGHLDSFMSCSEHFDLDDGTRLELFNRRVDGGWLCNDYEATRYDRIGDKIRTYQI